MFGRYEKTECRVVFNERPKVSMGKGVGGGYKVDSKKDKGGGVRGKGHIGRKAQGGGKAQLGKQWLSRNPRRGNDEPSEQARIGGRGVSALVCRHHNLLGHRKSNIFSRL